MATGSSYSYSLPFVFSRPFPNCGKLLQMFLIYSLVNSPVPSCGKRFELFLIHSLLCCWFVPSGGKLFQRFMNNFYVQLFGYKICQSVPASPVSLACVHPSVPNCGRLFQLFLNLCCVQQYCSKLWPSSCSRITFVCSCSVPSCVKPFQLFLFHPG